MMATLTMLATVGQPPMAPPTDMELFVEFAKGAAVPFLAGAIAFVVLFGESRVRRTIGLLVIGTCASLIAAFLYKNIVDFSYDQNFYARYYRCRDGILIGTATFWFALMIWYNRGSKKDEQSGTNSSETEKSDLG
jgi:hypothetical protein